jgi:hypothetical protein
LLACGGKAVFLFALWSGRRRHGRRHTVGAQRDGSPIVEPGRGGEYRAFVTNINFVASMS